MHRQAIHMTLPVPEQEPHLSPPTLTGPVPAWLIRPWLFASAAALTQWSLCKPIQASAGAETSSGNDACSEGKRPQNLKPA